MAWIVLVLAGLMEAVWATALARIESVTDWVPISIWLAGMPLSMLGLGYALRSLPLGVAYAMWVGIGAVATVAAGYLLNDENLPPARVFCLALIVVGIVGLRLTMTETA